MKIIKQARELRDRYLEEVNAPGSNLLPEAWTKGKYDVSRARLVEVAPSELKQIPLLKAA